MQTKSERYKWIILLIGAILVSTACGLFSGVADTVGDVASDLEGVATQVQGFATEVDLGDLEATTEAMATQVFEKGVPETMEALVTELSDPDEGVRATFEAIVTQGSFDMGEAPDDIPILAEEENSFFQSQDVVSYFSSVGINEVMEYYKEQMPNYGWTLDNAFESEKVVVLNYEKGERRAIVTLSINPLDGKTVVLITIQSE
jgi:hypothetical protein